MKDDLVERCVRALEEADSAVSSYEDLANAVLSIARPAILEEAAATERRRIFDGLMRMYEGWDRNPGAVDSGAIALSNAIFFLFPELREEAKRKAAEYAKSCALAHTTGQEPAPTCPICAEPFKADEICATDINEGTCHAECLEGSPVVDLDTGEPSDGPIDTFIYGQEGGR